MQVILLLLSTLSFLNLSLATTQSGAGPHVGAVIGRLPQINNHNHKRHHGIASLGSSHLNHPQKRTTNFKRAELSIAEEAAGLQSAVYAIIVSISSGLGNAAALIGGVKNVELNSAPVAVAAQPVDFSPPPVAPIVVVQAPVVTLDITPSVASTALISTPTDTSDDSSDDEFEDTCAPDDPPSS